MRSRPRSHGVAFGLVALALMASACGGAASGANGGTRAADPAGSGPPAAPQSPVAEKTRGPEPPVAEVLRFHAPRLGGGRIDGADYAGRDLAVWFWAPW